MPDIEGWLSEIHRAVEPLLTDRGLGIVEPPEPALSRRVADTGFPGVLPLWASRHYVVGLLASPWAEPRAWAGAIIQNGQGLTLATDARTLVPQLIVNRMLSNAPGAAERLSEDWSTIGDRVRALNEVLGGSEDALNVVLSAVGEPETRSTFKYREGETAGFEAAHSKLLRRIDSSEAFRRFADWLDACIADRCPAPEDPPSYGAWERRVLCLKSRLPPLRPGTDKLPPASLLQVIEANAGIDSGVPVAASWHSQPGGASGESALVEAAMQLDGRTAPTDRISDGLLRALLNEGSSYRGLAHAEAVVALDEGGEPERAWGALLSAAWWAARNAGEVPRSIRDGANFLAGRHAWTEVEWTVARGIGAV